MRALSSYDYAIVRLVPSVEREECINVGVILFSRTRRFLGMRTHLDEQRLAAFAPTTDLEVVKEHLSHLERVCGGGKEAGPIGQLSQSERFHWLVSPRSTIIQISPVHSGVSEDPEGALNRLFDMMVM